MNLILLLIILFTIYILYTKYNIKKKISIEKLQNEKKPYLWFYTENEYNCRHWESFYSRMTRDNYPNCLKLSIYSIYKHCHMDFNIVNLTPNNLSQYLPDLNISSKTNILQKYQIISSGIMYQYGGLWLPPWIIILKSLKPIINKLESKSVVVFGCPDKFLRCNKDSLSNLEVLASRPNIILWKKLYDSLIENNSLYLNSAYNFINIGRCKFWRIFGKRQNILYIYDSRYDGTRDYNGKLITNQELFSYNNILLQDEEKCFFVLYNYKNIHRNIKYRWFLRMSLEQILDSNLWISKIYKKSLLNMIDNSDIPFIYNTSTRNT